MTNPRFTDLFALAHPIVQAPMAGVTTPELAAAVSNAGALGSLGLGAGDVDAARQAIRRTRELTHAPFNVNFFCHEDAAPDAELDAAWLARLAPHFERFGAAPPAGLETIYRPIDADPGMQAMLLEAQPAVVSFHFGVPNADLIAGIQAYGGRVLVCVTTLGEAEVAAAAGVDALIAQGSEAGGHRGNFDAAIDERIGTLALVRQLVRVVDTPVIAAGGIMDGAGIRAVLELGAIGAQLGTAFVLCPESAAGAGYRAALASPRARHTEITSAISGRPARGIVGVFQQDIEPGDPSVIAPYPRAYDGAKQLNAAAKARDHVDYLPNWAGQAAALARELPAAELVAVLAEELAKAGATAPAH